MLSTGNRSLEPLSYCFCSLQSKSLNGISCAQLPNLRAWWIYYWLDNCTLFSFKLPGGSSRHPHGENVGIATCPGRPFLRGRDVRKGSTQTVLNPVPEADSSWGLAAADPSNKTLVPSNFCPKK